MSVGRSERSLNLPELGSATDLCFVPRVAVRCGDPPLGGSRSTVVGVGNDIASPWPVRVPFLLLPAPRGVPGWISVTSCAGEVLFASSMVQSIWGLFGISSLDLTGFFIGPSPSLVAGLEIAYPPWRLGRSDPSSRGPGPSPICVLAYPLSRHFITYCYNQYGFNFN